MVFPPWGTSRSARGAVGARVAGDRLWVSLGTSPARSAPPVLKAALGWAFALLHCRDF